MIETTIPLAGPDETVQLFGIGDQHLKRVRQLVPAKIATRNGRIHLSGDEEAVLQAAAVFERLKQVIGQDGVLHADQVDAVLAEIVHGASPAELAPEELAKTSKKADTSPRSESTNKKSDSKKSDSRKVELQQPGLTIRPRTEGQEAYLDAIRDHDMVFCVGPAGTGKTYLAVAAAVEALKEKQIRKIVLVRPAVEAGESLGFLPGDLHAKINPYLRPLLDALGEMMDYDQLQRYTADDIIEVAPLAYMRGRTLNNAYIIMDEAQNTTVAQMKMFLTRMGSNSKVVVTGDATQVDLPTGTMSGLTDALRRLDRIEGIACVRLGRADIVRHRLVNAIVDAYEKGPRH